MILRFSVDEHLSQCSVVLVDSVECTAVLGEEERCDTLDDFAEKS